MDEMQVLQDWALIFGIGSVFGGILLAYVIRRITHWEK